MPNNQTDKFEINRLALSSSSDGIVIEMELVLFDLPTSASPSVLSDIHKSELDKIFIKPDVSRTKIIIQQIDGFASLSGDSFYNFELSDMRANEVADYLYTLSNDPRTKHNGNKALFIPPPLGSTDPRNLEEYQEYTGTIPHGEAEAVPEDERRTSLDPNNPWDRKVVITYKIITTFPQPSSSLGNMSRNWGLGFGHSVAPPSFLTPFTSFGTAQLTMKPDSGTTGGSTNFPGPARTVNCQAVILSFELASIGLGKILEKIKVMKKITKPLADMLNRIPDLNDIILGGNGQANSAGLTPAAAKARLVAEMKLKVRENVNFLPSVELSVDDFPNENGFTTISPYSFSDLQGLQFVGFDINAVVPGGFLGVTISVYLIAIQVNPPIFFINLGFSSGFDFSPGGVSLEGKLISLNLNSI
jgi:hypothetical protein